VTDRLCVHLYGRHVADLVDDGDGLVSLQYTDEALRAGAPARLSVSLPVTRDVYPSLRGALRWVRALLPEGRALDVLVDETGVPSDDVFSLLSVVGRDVAGAAIIIRPDEDPALPEARYEPLTEDELAAAIDGVGRHPLGLDLERGVRLSLAGVQDKLLLHRPARSKTLYRPLHGAASTLIVKPEPDPDDRARLPLPGLATNELFCLLLARAVGLEAADASVIDVAGRPCLVVERYDRERRTVPPTRLHQEDLLTAAGRDPRLKYENPTTVTFGAAGGFADREPVRSEPGPSLAELAELLRRQLGTGVLARFLQAVAFNVAVGNADAHARNYSLLLVPSGRIRMAPLYDLVSTRAYEELDRQAAQRIGGVSDLDDIGRDELVAEAAGWGVPARTAARLIDGVFRRTSEALDATARRVVAREGDEEVAESLRQLIVGRVRSINGGHP
jgi:serine/threonine-protein kinase HipA